MIPVFCSPQRTASVLALVIVALSPLRGVAGQAVLRGRVLNDATRGPVAGAEVSLTGVERRVLTDSSGSFHIDDLDAGWQVVQVRKVGFAMRRDTVNVRDNAPTTHDFLLTSQTRLDTVKTVATEHRYISPGLQQFEERRQNATAGHFITEDDLRKADEKSLAGVIVQKAPGLHSIVRGGYNYLASSRKECSGPVFAQTEASCQACYVTVYVDGQLIYEANPARATSAQNPPPPPPDFNLFPVRDYAAVEFYPGSGTAPAQFGRTNSGCGVLLLWTRER